MLHDMAAGSFTIEEEEKEDSESAKKIASTIEVLMELGRRKGFEAGKDYGAGPIDVVWHIASHPALGDVTCGFIVMEPLA